MNAPIFEVTTSYTKHGCSIWGHLVVVRYDHLIQKPNAIKFGDYEYEYWEERCKKLVRELYGEYTRVRLGVPDLVVEYGSPPQLRGKNETQ